MPSRGMSTVVNGSFVGPSGSARFRGNRLGMGSTLPLTVSCSKGQGRWRRRENRLFDPLFSPRESVPRKSAGREKFRSLPAPSVR